MSSFLEKRLKREKAARIQAEQILEAKSRELFLKNEELKELNGKLASTLSLKVDELQESEAQRFTIFENSAVGIALTIHGQILKTNDTFAQMLGYEVNDIIGTNIEDLSYKDDVEGFIESIKKLDEAKLDKLTIQKRYRRKNKSYFWANTHVSVVKDEEGNIKYHLSVIENIHEKKIAERKTEMLVEQLKDINERLESFAHVVSHDLKSPVTGINTILNWMEDCELSEDVQEYHGMMKGLTLKMYKLIDNVIAYSKTDINQEQNEAFNMGDLIDECTQYLPVLNHIEVLKEGKFPNIWANRTKLQQVFSNLIDNALKHNDKEKGWIKITSTEDKYFWVFKIKDNGEGIEDKHFSRIFRMFETLDAEIGGTGIGLSLVKKIVNQYGGTISVQSEVGVFTEFTISLLKSETVK